MLFNVSECQDEVIVFYKESYIFFGLSSGVQNIGKESSRPSSRCDT